MINKLLRLFLPFLFKEQASVLDEVTFPARYEKQPKYLSGKKKRGRPKKAANG
tara:strand:+ start:374 stop:532 length:159 start_codon:yes stop_codon:yes gene_type:complete